MKTVVMDPEEAAERLEGLPSGSVLTFEGTIHILVMESSNGREYLVVEPGNRVLFITDNEAVAVTAVQSIASDLGFGGMEEEMVN